MNSRQGNLVVDKAQFDAVLAKLLKSPPIPLASISPKPKKARPKNQAQKEKPSSR